MTRGKRIRILQVIDNLGAGGAQELLLGLGKHINKGEFQLDVCCLHGTGMYAKEIGDLGLQVYSLSHIKSNPLIPLLLLKLIRGKGYQILHLHLEASTICGAIAGRLGGTPRIVATIHGLREQFPSWFLPLCATLSPLFDKFVAEVQLSRKELIEEGIPEAKIEYIPIGTDFFDRINRENRRAILRDEFGIDEGTPLILSIARLHKHKGHIYLIKAMADVVRKVPAAKLMIVGDGPMRPALEKATAQLGLTRNVIFAGFRRDLMALYSACDVLAMPSVREALGIVTIQAMACARPVVAFNVGAMSEAIIHGDTGLLVPPRDASALAQALVRLLKEPLLRKELGLRAKAFVRENFDLKALVRKYEELYKALCMGISR